MNVTQLKSANPPSRKYAGSGPKILVVSGSPTSPSKTELLASMVAADLSGATVDVTHLILRELPVGPLVGLDFDNPQIAAAIEAVAEADGIVIATPTYKASFSGLLKLFLDILPQFGFSDKAVLPLATGGTLAHVLALDYGLRPVLQSMGARWVVPSYFVTSDAFIIKDDKTSLEPKFDDGLDLAVRAFCDALSIQANRAA